jgi:RimJ/RimL family protein N-acetyltransferase
VSTAWIERIAALAPLVGESVRLEPLARAHHAGLCEIGLDADLWRWTLSVVRKPEEMSAYIEDALRQRAMGTAFPFVLVDAASGRPAGSTRYGALDEVNRRLEIGWTWVGRPWQRTRLNTEAKYLLLRMAFEELGCIRVEFKTDVLNERSRTALTRIGAHPEGVLRSHMITAAGRIRDTIYFSILEAEWPGVRARLEERLR